MAVQVVIEIRDGSVQSVRSFDGQTVKGVVVDYDGPSMLTRFPNLRIEQVGDDAAHVYIAHESGKPRNLGRLIELWKEHKKHDR